MFTLNMPPSFLLQANHFMGLCEDEGKVGLSLNGTQGKEASSDRRCCFEQDTSSQLTRAQRQMLLPETVGYPLLSQAFLLLGSW